jgi:hypothetical protein
VLEAPKPDDDLLDFWNIGDVDIPFEVEEDLVPTSTLPPPAAPPINTLPPPAQTPPRPPQSLDNDPNGSSWYNPDYTPPVPEPEAP